MPILNRYRNKKTTPGLLVLIGKSIFNLIKGSRLDAVALANKFYKAAAGYLPDIKPRKYEIQTLQKGLAKFVKADGAPFDDKKISQVTAIADGHVEGAARNQTKDLAGKDPECLGYFRYDPKPPTCYFCMVMISRGPVYKSEESASERITDNQAWHYRCSCKALPLFKGKKWKEEKQWEAAETAYRALSKKYGASLKQIRHGLKNDHIPLPKV